MEKENNSIIDFMIDSHCHLNLLRDDRKMDLKEILDNAIKNNVKIINNISTKVDEFSEILDVANSNNGVFATIGVHPSEAINCLPKLSDLLEYSKYDKVIGFGESGLEYHYEPIDKQLQKKNFEIHIEASRQTKLPLIIHSRDADYDMIDILKTEMKNGEFNFLLHCFSSGKELCWTGLDLGGYISLSGIVTFKKSEELRDIVKNIPINRLLVETDSPFLAPEPYRGKINEPAYVKNIVNYLVDFLKIDYNILVNSIAKNFFSLFNKINTGNL